MTESLQLKLILLASLVATGFDKVVHDWAAQALGNLCDG